MANLLMTMRGDDEILATLDDFLELDNYKRVRDEARFSLGMCGWVDEVFEIPFERAKIGEEEAKYDVFFVKLKRKPPKDVLEEDMGDYHKCVRKDGVVKIDLSAVLPLMPNPIPDGPEEAGEEAGEEAWEREGWVGKPENLGKRWLDRHDGELKKLFNRGYDDFSIAYDLGRTVAGVRKRRVQLGLTNEKRGRGARETWLNFDYRLRVLERKVKKLEGRS